MKTIIVSAILAFMGFNSFASAQEKTESGIPLEAQWQKKVYEFAQANLKHPAWGWAHSERDYNVALELAIADKLTVDKDILFAAAFLHDMGAIDPYSQDNVDHALRSTQVCEAILREAGFPMDKFPQVKEAILAHMYDASTSKLPEAIVLHDADTLDFMGTIGVARRLSTTGSGTDFRRPLKTIERESDNLSSKLLTEAARKMGSQRAEETKVFLKALAAETFGNKLL
jgi:uncharacterized protein